MGADDAAQKRLMRRGAYLAGAIVVLLGLALYYGIRALGNPCIDAFAATDPPGTARAETKIFLSRATALYEQQQNEYDSPHDAHLTKPLKVNVSGRTAGLWISGPMYAGDFRYAQIWQQTYRHYHNGSSCVHLRLLWKNGSAMQQFPVDDL